MQIEKNIPEPWPMINEAEFEQMRNGVFCDEIELLFDVFDQGHYNLPALSIRHSDECWYTHYKQDGQSEIDFLKYAHANLRRNLAGGNALIYVTLHPLPQKLIDLLSRSYGFQFNGAQIVKFSVCKTGQYMTIACPVKEDGLETWDMEISGLEMRADIIDGILEQSAPEFRRLLTRFLGLASGQDSESVANPLIN